MRVLLVEPYYSGSHRAWANGLVEHSSHEVRLLTHPGRWWKWRMRGAAVTLAASLRELNGWRPDLVVVSGMIDLAHFRALTRKVTGDLPMVLYLHETQLTYPNPPGAPIDDSYAFTNWISACSADRVLFNSGYHMDVFFDHLPELLGKFPDHRHDELIPDVRERSEVLPVGVDLSWISHRPPRSAPPTILWNHRWEFDKDPESFADAVEYLVGKGADFELTLLGSRSDHPPRALQRIREIASDHIVHDGEAPAELYRKLVARSDIVVSTSNQEFFGISIVEAVAAGCRPVVPNRLSYPWLIPQRHHSEVLYEGDLGPSLLEALARPSTPDGLAGDMARYSWEAMGPVYDARFEELSRSS